jgi:hypothetical protein
MLVKMTLIPTSWPARANGAHSRHSSVKQALLGQVILPAADFRRDCGNLAAGGCGPKQL